MPAGILSDLPEWIKAAHVFVDKVSWVKTGIGLLTGAGAAYQFFAKRLSNRQGEIARLTAKLEGVDKAHSRIFEELKEMTAERDRLLKLQPRTVLARAERESGEHNYEPAHLAVRAWLQSEGERISQLLVWRTKWVIAHAAGDEIRPAGLVAAQAYTRAAVALWPENEEAQELLGEVSAMLHEDQRPSPSVREALLDFDERATELYRQGDIDAADAAENEARRCFQNVQWHTALALVELAMSLRLRNQGRSDLRTFGPMRLQVLILEALGRYKEALDLAQALVAAMIAHPFLGPDHPHTLSCLYDVAGLLGHLGTYQEALELARSVAATQAALPSLSPDDPNILASRFLIATFLARLGRHQEALDSAQPLSAAMVAHPALGPDHPETLSSFSQISYFLEQLGRNDEALKIAHAAANAMAAHPLRGPDHPATLRVRSHVVSILADLGRYEEALELIQTVEEVQAAHPSLGPHHPNTVTSRTQLASLLLRLGRQEEALRYALLVADAHTRSPANQPLRPETLLNSFRLAGVLESAGKYGEALLLAQSVANASTLHPSLGPAHEDTLRSREMVERLQATINAAAISVQRDGDALSEAV